MNKKLLLFTTLLAVFLLTFSVASAQRNGNGRGVPNGNGMGAAGTVDTTSPNSNGSMGTNCPTGDCVPTPQNNNYGYNGTGIPGSGNQYGQRGANTGTGGYTYGGGLFVNLPPAYEGELPEDVIALMVDGWLDEQNAYAIYQTVIDQLGAVAPFVNIQRAEAQHAAAWELLLERYGITAPDVPALPEVSFDTLADACSAAAAAEIANFGLYNTMLETFAPYPDILQIATALRNASEFSHLPAFENCAN